MDVLDQTSETLRRLAVQFEELAQSTSDISTAAFSDLEFLQMQITTIVRSQSMILQHMALLAGVMVCLREGVKIPPAELSRDVEATE